MSSFTLSTLPIINVAPLLDSGHDDAELRASTSVALHDACVQYGFFYLDISAYVDPSEPEQLVELARSFFSLPQEEKDKLSLKHEDNARGYATLKENVTKGKADNHEGLDFYKPVENPDKTKPLWGENQWPSVLDFKDKYQRWVEKMKALGLIVMRAMADGLRMSPEEWQELRDQVDDSFWVMRVIGYPPLPEDHDGISCGAHKDYGCLTFLHADPTPSALQVYLRRPGVVKGMWINADPIPGCVVCNIGEMWEIWSNGLYRSTLHRVVHRGTNYRYGLPFVYLFAKSFMSHGNPRSTLHNSISIPFFFEPNFNAHIKPLDAARRIQAGDTSRETIAGVNRSPVVYGDFLLKKVGNNFASGEGRYDN